MNRLVRAVPLPLIVFGLLLCQKDESPEDYGNVGLEDIVHERLDRPQSNQGIRFGMAQKRMSGLKQSNSDDRRH